MENRAYICIDLKSFYASVECGERGLDPLTTNLVVADKSRTEKTICLAVSPSLKAYGISGRARLFEVTEAVNRANIERLSKAPGHKFTGKSFDSTELKAHPELELDYIAAPPRMSYYMEYSTRIFNIYIKYISPEDIHVYSIDEVFIDATSYLKLYNMTAHELAIKLIREVLASTRITATAGIGTNMYLAKIAMDIVAKHAEPDKDGVRIAELDEMSYRRILWSHTPLTDFWRVGRGYAKRLNSVGLYTMGDIAKCSVGDPSGYYNEDLLYKLFGVNAELLIDHAWGWESATIADVKAYKPKSNSLSSGQVLHCPYDFNQARLIVREMTDSLILDLVEKGLVTKQIVLTVGYDIENLTNPEIRKKYHGAVTTDHYGRRVPKHSQGVHSFDTATSSTRLIINAMLKLYDSEVNPALLIRRITVAAAGLADENTVELKSSFEQLDLFTDYEAVGKEREKQEREKTKEKHMQQAILEIKSKYGKNMLVKGMNLKEGATAMDRNNQVGGHKA